MDKAKGTWRRMLLRCNNPKSTGYQHYGGRGIRVCDRWMDFQTFLADMGEPPQGMSIDRINNDGNYEPSNCRWATRQEQNSNTSRNVYVTVDGRRATLADLARLVGISRQRMHQRFKALKRGEDTKALLRPRGT